MCKILIFGGTTEGRELAEFCEQQGIPAWLSVVSDYGKTLLGETRMVRIVQGAMECSEMQNFIHSRQIELVVDATHPHAKKVSQNISLACREENVTLVRCLRREMQAPDANRPGNAQTVLHQPEELPPGIHIVPDVQAAAAFLQETEGTVLVTTGSRELAAFQALSGYRERIFARVLPSSAVLKQCEELGISGNHLIGMQGPFSAAMNEAMIRQLGVSWLVTKESGAAGGYQEKLDAAAACGIGVIVIQRPAEDGMALSEVCRLLEERFLPKYRIRPEAEAAAEAGAEVKNRVLILAGIGSGAAEQMTLEVLEAVCSSDVVLGAGRMLEAAKEALNKVRRDWPGAEELKRQPVFIEGYQGEHILALLQEHPKWQAVTVLYSGDTGFYSGASQLADLLAEKGISCRILPGISSVSAFVAKLKTSWSDAWLCSAHGRELNVRELMEQTEKRWLILMGGNNGAGRFLKELVDLGYGSRIVSVGENISYPNERIRTGRARELAGEEFQSLSLIMIEREPEE